MTMNLADVRKDYILKTLSEDQVLKDPAEQFLLWFREAVDASVNEPNAMHLSTVDEQRQPNGRIVLLKSCDATGFTFFTNYQSRKGAELAANPFASLTFFWPELERQVRIQGAVKFVSEHDSDAYFKSRPRGSRIGAWVSDQSQIIDSRQTLETRQKELEHQFQNSEVPRPAHWGGYCLEPARVEFWQGRASRLHDRICYTKSVNGGWKIERLAP